MPQADIPFPRSSMPGQQPGEGQGRLINAYCEVNGSEALWRPVPGSKPYAKIVDSYNGNAPVLNTRGLIVKNNLLHVVQDTKMFTITVGDTLTQLGGEIGGSLPVTMALNNKAPDRDLVIVTEVGPYILNGNTVEDLNEPNLPMPNSVCSLDGYFIYTTGDGRIFASELNDKTVNALSFTTAEANPDGILRGTVHANQFFAWGPTSVEVYQDVGATPFPLQRVAVLPIGLLAKYSVAGYEYGWSADQIFVASDSTVRRLVGYDPVKISNKFVERAIQRVVDKNTIRALVYVFDGNQIWSLSSPDWTWEYNLTTGFWHERQTTSMKRWFCEDSALFDNQWVLSRLETNELLYLDSRLFEDDGTPIAMTIESGQVKDFPSRVNVPAAFFDWTTGTAPPTGGPDISDPEISVQWSKDGGGHWSNQVIAPSLGPTGHYAESVRVNRVGLATRQGIMFRLMTTSPIYRACRGGRVEYQVRGPA